MPEEGGPSTSKASSKRFRSDESSPGVEAKKQRGPPPVGSNLLVAEPERPLTRGVGDLPLRADLYYSQKGGSTADKKNPRGPTLRSKTVARGDRHNPHRIREAESAVRGLKGEFPPQGRGMEDAALEQAAGSPVLAIDEIAGKPRHPQGKFDG
ncbi:hypothetical protein JTB14_027047 [Gonioctena quinquepunctata]|nr:hypothetical protein JTB14_027047 [Gonioctena quinquepunctata]